MNSFSSNDAPHTESLVQSRDNRTAPAWLTTHIFLTGSSSVPDLLVADPFANRSEAEILAEAWRKAIDQTFQQPSPRSPVGLSRETELTRLLAKLSRISEQDNSDDAVPLSQTGLNTAREILDGLPRALSLPQISVSSDGEIIYTWFRGDDRLEAIQAPDHYLTWVFRLDGTVTDGAVIVLDECVSRDPFYKAVADFHG